MDIAKSEEEQIRGYVEDQADEEVLHLEKAASELVGPVRHAIWDVHCPQSRWWVVTNPLNLYNQMDFRSREVVLTFHVGLTLRVAYLQERQVPITPGAADLLPGAWRRWQQAFEAYERGDEAEDLQAVGMRLRECLVSFVADTASGELVPEGTDPPKMADFRGWAELLAKHLAAGKSSARLRSYLRELADETWAYVNWLTHARNAIRTDAEIGLKAVEHLLGAFTAARLRLRDGPRRCQQCGSYEVVAGSCRHCDWRDPSHRSPEMPGWSEEERARRLAEPCTLSSDISTFMRPRDFT